MLRKTLRFSLRPRITIPTINYVICSDGLHKFQVNVHFNVSTRQNLTCARRSHVAREYFNLQLHSLPWCLKSRSYAAESREYIYITYPPRIVIFRYRLFGIYPRVSPSQWCRLHGVRGCTFRLNGRKHVIRRGA